MTFTAYAEGYDEPVVVEAPTASVAWPVARKQFPHSNSIRLEHTSELLAAAR